MGNGGAQLRDSSNLRVFLKPKPEKVRLRLFYGGQGASILTNPLLTTVPSGRLASPLGQLLAKLCASEESQFPDAVRCFPEIHALRREVAHQ